MTEKRTEEGAATIVSRLAEYTETDVQTPHGIYDELRCFFCGMDEGGDHKQDCLRVLAKAALADPSGKAPEKAEEVMQTDSSNRVHMRTMQHVSESATSPSSVAASAGGGEEPNFEGIGDFYEEVMQTETDIRSVPATGAASHSEIELCKCGHTKHLGVCGVLISYEDRQLCGCDTKLFAAQPQPPAPSLPDLEELTKIIWQSDDEWNKLEKRQALDVSADWGEWLATSVLEFLKRGDFLKGGER